jgi:hypothetical protein
VTILSIVAIVLGILSINEIWGERDMKIVKGYFLVLMASLIGFMFTYVSDANAIPAFARKYDVACTLCHTTFPKLNDFGVNFRDNGYQMGADGDLPTNLDKGYFPLSFRTTVGYQYASQHNVQSASGNGTDAYFSGLGSTSMDMLSAGTLDRDISFLVVPTGEFSLLGGATVFHLESAWIRFDNLMGTSLLNLKIGNGDIDLPFSEHRSLTLADNYVIYHYIPGVPYNSGLIIGDSTATSLGTTSGFQFGSHQGIIQLMGHTMDSLGKFRYAVNLISNDQYGGHDTGYYVHITQAMQGGGYSSGYRGGLFYLNMPIPTTLNDNIGLANAPSVGSNSRSETKYGFDLSGNFLENKLNIFGVVLFGQDAQELINNNLGANVSASPKYWGGFIEANYIAMPKLVLIGRYDWIKNTSQPCDQINTNVGGAGGCAPANSALVPNTVISSDGYNDVDAYTIAARYALVIHNRGEIWVHTELNETTNKGTAFNGDDLRNDTVFLGLDFAF